MKTKLKEKNKLCVELVNLGKKHVTKDDIKNAAKKNGLSFNQAERAWMNFQETAGKSTDRRVRNNGKKTIHLVPSIKSGFSKRRDVSADEAGSIMLEYLGSNALTSRELCIKYKISVIQFYEWIHELNTSGTICGVKVLKPEKYAKVEVKDVIWFAKHPNTRRKSIKALSYYEKVAYKRVADILREYLPRI